MTSHPGQLRSFGALINMRIDMYKVIAVGGRVINYDDISSKTTFAGVYLLLSGDAGSRPQELLT